MVFNSLEFIVFFVIVTTLYFILNKWGKLFLLLIASCIFYMAFVPKYILILAITIVVDYFAGIMVYKAVTKKKKSFL